MDRRDFLKSTPAFAGLLMGYCSPKSRKAETIEQIIDRQKTDLSGWPFSFWKDEHIMTKIIIPRDSPYLPVANKLNVTIGKDMKPWEIKEMPDPKLRLVFYEDQIKNLYDQNTIIIGCENKWAEEFLEGENCYKGLKKAAARIQTKMIKVPKEYSGKQNEKRLAMLVTGHNTDDLMKAAEYLSNYRIHKDKLKGSDVKIQTK